MELEPSGAENKLSILSQIKNLGYERIVVDKDCVLHEALMLLADKWTLPVLLSLMQGPKRTSNLLREVNPVSPKMLVQTLKKLEDAELIQRKVYPVVPPMVEYSLTETGLGLNQALSELFEWSIKRASKKKETAAMASPDKG
ncbi:transcriptional regulator, HxlR family [Chitinophaga sp. YR627]|uniref:winged helix-turn-helix transcriptional regulator n=1 Tax=Chitinophaga sp. YR627 TaxID=1881041 RepID=UPI0008EFCA2F|nr:helix-turn-helix domain-containing protein [Chitinophaga sp. YR627]SFO20487.1 transcriptional regulator, HxlR family [Chitinophaga sp. YR627]